MVKETYLQLHFDIPAAQKELLIALLSEIDFYAFEEQEQGLEAFILEKDYREALLLQSLRPFFPDLELPPTTERIEAKDWNAEWEANFESVQVGDFCEIRPPFRDSSHSTQHDLIIHPRMAFGTGHHATTWLMVEQCAHLDFKEKDVLDMGCGTGVLGILAHKLGADSVCGIDSDPWSYENAPANARLNGIEDIYFVHGTADRIPDLACYDIILANINRNVLLDDRDIYLSHLDVGGTIVLSGIYNFDEQKLADHYLEAGLEPRRRAERGDWVSLSFLKSENRK